MPRAYCRTDTRVSAVMIEVNRRLYLDEGHSSPGFWRLPAEAGHGIAGLIEAAA